MFGDMMVGLGSSSWFFSFNKKMCGSWKLLLFLVFRTFIAITYQTWELVRVVLCFLLLNVGFSFLLLTFASEPCHRFHSFQAKWKGFQHNTLGLGLSLPK